MKAIVYREYGGPEVLRLEETAQEPPKEGEVLLRIRAASVNPYDWHFLRGDPYFLRLIAGPRKPRMIRLGADVAGTVEAVGSKVTRFNAGDEVFGTCRGSFAESVCARESLLGAKPAAISFEQAAAAPVAGVTALQALTRKKPIRPGEKVLVNGASGGVGTFAVQIAKAFGGEATGVCSTRHVEMVRSIGAARVIDYTREDFTKTGDRYDLFLDNAATHSLSEVRRVLNPGGRYVLVGGPTTAWTTGIGSFVGARLLSFFGSRKMGVHLTRPSSDDLATLADMMASGKVTPVLDRTYPLADVAEAIRYQEEGHARGKVVIAVGAPRVD